MLRRPRIGLTLFALFLLSACGDKPNRGDTTITGPFQLADIPSFLDMGEGSDRGVDSVIDPFNGTLIAATAGNDLGVIRVGDNGKLDPNFGNGGFARTDIMGDETAYAIARNSLGHTYVLGTSEGMYKRLAMACYRENGQLETRFNQIQGYWKQGKFAYERKTEGRALAVDSQDRLYIVGKWLNNQRWYLLTFRFLPNGNFDHTFKTYVTDIGRGLAGSVSAVVDKSNRLYVSGKALRSGQEDAFIVRFREDGIIDGGFGDRGRVFLDVGGNETFRSITIDEEERLIVAGQLNGAAGYHVLVARYLMNGDIDASFGNKGIVYRQYPGVVHGHSVAVLPSGQIAVAGKSRRGEKSIPFVELIERNGGLAKGPRTYEYNGDGFARSVNYNTNTGQLVIIGYGSPIRGKQYQVMGVTLSPDYFRQQLLSFFSNIYTSLLG